MKQPVTLSFVLVMAMSCSPCCRGPGDPDPIASGDLAFEINERENCCTPISPLIYGTNNWQLDGSYHGYYPFRRLGGEGWSAYNWEKNTTHDEGASRNVDTPRDPNPGGSIVTRVASPVANGDKILVTIPLLDCVAADGVAPPPDPDPNCGSGSTSLPSARFKRSLAEKGTSLVSPADRPDPDDSYVYQDEFINWLKFRFTDARVNATDGSFFFALDNEPDIWHGDPHNAIHSPYPTYDEVVKRNKEYGAMIKKHAPNAFVFGPVASGWNGIWRWEGGEPFIVHYLEAMKQAETDPTLGSRRVIDVLDVHWYPENRLYIDGDGDGIQDRTEDRDGDGVLDPGEDVDGDGVLDVYNEPNYYCDKNKNGVRDESRDPAVNEPEYRAFDELSDVPSTCPDPATSLTSVQHAALVTQLERMRLHAPRSLSDPSYDEGSWITRTLPAGDKPIKLLPRLKALIAGHYSGTKLAVTEYYYGGGKDITGGIAQADALGMFGREDVFAASLWEYADRRTGDANAYEYIDAAFDMYRNFGGSNASSGRFGPNSVPATTSNKEISSIYASNGGTEQIVAVALNRDLSEKTAALRIRSCSCYDRYTIYRLSQGTARPQGASNLILDAKLNALRFTLPARTVVTIVAHRKTPGMGNLFSTSSCRDW